MITVGIDVGTAAVKIVFADQLELLWKRTLPSTSANPDACVRLFESGLAELALREEDIGGMAATGYGSHLVGRAGKRVNEISANAMGVWLLSGRKAGTVINVGGQDVKVIKFSETGKATDFKMNDKCAAGTGRFFEMAERILNVPLSEFGALGLLSVSPLRINNTCAVFAETELVSLIAEGKNKNDIIAALNRSIAERIAALASGLELEDEVYLDGGPALNNGLRTAIADELMREVKVLPHPQFTAAFGATALLTQQK
ncbi:MAG: acyl-CoA dehydratase activase [Victivallaceae bacterium]|nr:acyl-CoA dehydratase activase [Victivallaceae bacterium]